MISVIFAALFAVILGLAFCFAGYRLFLVMLPIWGFFAGFWLGAEFTTLLLGTGFLATTSSWVIGFVAGLAGALLSYLFYTIGVGLVAAGFGVALGSGFMAALGFQWGLLSVLVSLVVAVVMVVLTLGMNLQKFIIIAITAIGGANAILLSVLLLLGRVSLESLRMAGGSIGPLVRDSWFWVIAWLVLAIAGVVVQIRVNRSYEFSREQYVQGWG
jgi:hypothetical protein